MITEQRHIKSKDIIRVAGDVCESWSSFPFRVKIDVREEKHSSASVLPDQAEYSRKLLLSQSGNWYQRANLLSHSMPPPMSCCL